MTINGKFSVAEVQDLLAAKDVEVANLKAAVDAFGTHWQVIDPAAWQMFSADGRDAGKIGTAALGCKGQAEIALDAINPMPGPADPVRGVDGGHCEPAAGQGDGQPLRDPWRTLRVW